MIRRLLFLTLLFAAVLLPACAREPLKAAGRQGESAIGAVRDIGSAYQSRDIETFMERIASAYPDRDAFRKQVEDVFGTYQEVHFTAEFRKMLINVPFKGDVKVAFTWEGEWKTSGGKVVKDGARITFVLDRSSHKLVGVEGKNPFVPQATPMTVR